LTITHTAFAEPLTIGLGGTGYAPVVSFTPALIRTVPGTGVGAGILKSAQNLTVGGGDTLHRGYREQPHQGARLERNLNQDHSGIFHAGQSGRRQPRHHL
jgi:hypothetical protein